MGTPAFVGINQPDGDFLAVYDGYPEELGMKLLNLVLDLGGDLDRVWAFLSGPPEGWRFAFHEPYEVGDNRDFFATGRDDCLLRRDDEFSKPQIACRYLFDLQAPHSLSTFEDLMPFDLLDLDLEGPALSEAIKARVERCFG